MAATEIPVELEAKARRIRYRHIIRMLPRVTEAEARISLLAEIVWPRRPVREASLAAAAQDEEEVVL